MKTFRSIIVAASAAGLLALPLAASAEPPASSVFDHAASRYATAIRFLDFNHTRGFGSTLTIRGQLAVPSLGGAVAGKRVKLYRKLDGRSSWRYLATKYTSKKHAPKFRFLVVAVGNADYRAVFAGNAKLKRSSGTTGLSVYRTVSGKVNKHSQLHGRIAPHYGHRKVFLDRRACSNCGWHGSRSERAGGRGHYSFKLTAPRHGTYYWRITTPASTRFISSHSGVFATSR